MIPFITVILDKPYQIRFSARAMTEFEQITGVKLQSLDDNMSFDILMKMLWVMLKQDNESLTYDQALDLVDNYAESLTVIMEDITKAMNAAFPPKTAKEGTIPNE